MSSPSAKSHPGRLPRLPCEYYQGDAFVHWTLSTHDRATGWLMDRFYARFRELMLHAAAREGLLCPVYCLMPDHLHLVWMGLRLDSDQRNGMSFLRTYLEPALSPDAGASSRRSNCQAVSLSSLKNEAVLSSPLANRRDDEVTSRHLSIKFQPQAHDSVLRATERDHDAFARVCFYILDNPVKSQLVAGPEDWKFNGAVVPGYPTLHPLEADFWEKFWKIYTKCRHPDAGKIHRPSF